MDEKEDLTLVEKTVKAWEKLHGDPSIKAVSDLVAQKVTVFLDDHLKHLDETNIKLEKYAWTIQRLFNKAQAEEMLAKNAYNSKLKLEATHHEGKTVSERETKAISESTDLKELQKILEIKMKSKMYLQDLVTRIEAFVNVLKSVEKRRTKQD